MQEETLGQPIGIHVSVPTTAMKEAIAFYCGLLRLEIVSSSDDLTQLSIGRHRISLKAVAPTSESLQRGGSAGIRARHFGFRVRTREEVDAFAEIAAAKGHVLVAGPLTRAGERTVFCLDPSGNQVEVYSEGPSGKQRTS